MAQIYLLRDYHLKRMEQEAKKILNAVKYKSMDDLPIVPGAKPITIPHYHEGDSGDTGAA